MFLKFWVSRVEFEKTPEMDLIISLSKADFYKNLNKLLIFFFFFFLSKVNLIAI